MTKSYKISEDSLYQIAASQAGYFTTGQAIKAGFQDSTHPYHVRTGSWRREWRGIYRLARYPNSDDSHYVLWSLWSRNREGIPQGIYSHETALALYDLTDVMPAKIHMTVPRSFRRHSQVPQVLDLHFGQILSNEIEEREGYRVTKPMRTIIDLALEELISSEIINQALREGKQRGLITHSVVDSYLSKSFVNDKVRTIVRGIF